MKCTFAGPKTGNSEVEYWERRVVFVVHGLEIHGDPKHASHFTLGDRHGNVQVRELTPCCRHEVAGYVGR